MTTQSDITTRSPFGRVVLVDRPAKRPPTEERFADNFANALIALIPMWIVEVRAWSDEKIQREASAAAEVIGSHGDDLQYGGKKRGPALNAVAKAFALLARAEGGITGLGVHACLAAHDLCPAERGSQQLPRAAS
ncbi:hypothetical protein [Nocardia pseudovaccinii]|uniref:hypothetical protein n=1 Tax=Nocardia pseudovaccinii TaxID=189540 RepID=UPI0007A3D5EA|nr:hypothetical protein [Nocardia pseudovaccinii]